MKKLIVLMASFALLALLTVNQDVAASNKDTSKPTLNSFSVSDSSITEGDTVKINYSVKDSGGSHLKQVELWKGNSKGNLGRVESQTDTKCAGKDSASGSFSDKPSVGTVYYGIHIVDKSGNVGYDNGAKSVTVKARDTTKPKVTSFGVSSPSITIGSSVTISYSVKDDGGSGLKQVELWRSTDNRNWGEISNKRKSLSGNSYSGSFTDAPGSAGIYYYGVHVVDNSGNWDGEGGPKTVQVVAASQPPNVTGISVKPTSINAGQAALFNVTTDHAATKAVLRFTDANIEVSMSGSGTNWSANPQINNAGNRPFTVTAYDKNNKAGSSKNGTIQVIKQQDTTKPKVTNFGVSEQSVNLGSSVTISYAVKDDGGSGLKQVELWRSTDNRNWGEIKEKRRNLSGNTASGSFSDVPGAPGTYYYGAHVVDNNGNWDGEGGPKMVQVNNNPKPLNGWHGDGDTSVQKRIVAAAKAEDGKSSGQSVTGAGHDTDIAGGDGTKMLNAIKLHNDWKINSRAKTESKIKEEMRNAFKGSAYGSKQINSLVDRIIAVYDPKNIPGSEPAVLAYLGIRKQCHEWADYIGGDDKGVVSDLKKVRPGMGLFSSLPHVMIITDVNWKNGAPTQYKVCEANWASGWANPAGAVPWERTVKCGRVVAVTEGKVHSYE